LKLGSMRPPSEAWARRLDDALQAANGDYRAKRTGDLALVPPEVVWVEPGTFDAWLQSRGRLGGQHKVPRLTQDPVNLNALLAPRDRELSPTC